MDEYQVEERSHPAGMGGVQKLYRFPNGYGASVIRSSFSYGGDEGKWELGVIVWQSEAGDADYRFKLNYDTPITSDVEGHLEWLEVEELLERICNLEGVSK